MKTIRRCNKGITLVALVITVIVLIILAGITLSMVVGDGGLIEETDKTAQNMANSIGLENAIAQNLINELGELSQVKDDDITVLPEIPDGALEFGETVWENGKAKVSISTELEGAIIEYQINTTEGEWYRLGNGQEVTDLLYQNILYARLVKGNATGKVEQKVIEDTNLPTVTITAGTTTINSIPVTVTAVDGESGIAEDAEYQFYIGDTLQGTSTTNSYNYTGLSGNTDYTLKVKVRDKAGNLGEGTTVARTQIAPPTGWNQSNVYTSSGTFVAPKTGYYKFAAYAASGSGGSGTQFKYKSKGPDGQYDGYDKAYGGGSGGCGGYAESQFLLTEGQAISFTFSGGNISCNGINVTAGTSGGSPSTSSRGSAGRAGSASGGNLMNVQGKNGSSGGHWSGSNNAYCKFNAPKGGTNGYCTGGNGPSCDGWKSTGTSATSGNSAKLVVYSGNTN